MPKDKNGQEVEVIGLAGIAGPRACRPGSLVSVYRDKDGALWAEPYSDFQERQSF